MEGTDGQTDSGSTERKTNSRRYSKWNGLYRGPCHHQEFVNRSTNRQAECSTGNFRWQTTDRYLANTGGFGKELEAGGRVAAGRVGPDSGSQALRRWRDKQGLTT